MSWHHCIHNEFKLYEENLLNFKRSQTDPRPLRLMQGQTEEYTATASTSTAVSIENIFKKTAKCQSINKVSNVAVYKLANEVASGTQLPGLKDFFQTPNIKTNSLEFDARKALTNQKGASASAISPAANSCRETASFLPFKKVFDACRKAN